MDDGNSAEFFLLQNDTFNSRTANANYNGLFKNEIKSASRSPMYSELSIT